MYFQFPNSRCVIAKAFKLFYFPLAARMFPLLFARHLAFQSSNNRNSDEFRTFPYFHCWRKKNNEKSTILFAQTKETMPTAGGVYPAAIVSGRTPRCGQMQACAGKNHPVTPSCEATIQFFRSPPPLNKFPNTLTYKSVVILI